MRTPEQIEAFCQSAREHWQKEGSRNTGVRHVLCQALASAESPLAAEELLAEAHKIDRAISLASVYRTLASLEQAGLLRVVPGPRDLRCYMIAETDSTAIGNIVCTDCDRVVPLNDECLPLREGFIAKQLGFRSEKMNLRIEASCDELRLRGTCDRRKNKSDGQG
ncbi:MAG: Fur family transcriptional regulator [Opitutaceae bacterium]